MKPQLPLLLRTLCCCLPPVSLTPHCGRSAEAGCASADCARGDWKRATKKDRTAAMEDESRG
jgi:hypothetical protein